jgi:hypothetical protein
MNYNAALFRLEEMEDVQVNSIRKVTTFHQRASRVFGLKPRRSCRVIFDPVENPMHPSLHGKTELA